MSLGNLDNLNERDRQLQNSQLNVEQKSQQNRDLTGELDMGRVVTIDGPAASGKTSVSRELARRLGWHWVSTGAFYRGLAYAAQRLQLNLQDEELLSDLSRSHQWRVEMAESKTRVYFGDEDVTDEIGREDVGNVASKISHFPKVRESLLEGQRDCRERTEGLVAEGRDCGTVVFPNAEVKIYLTARSEDRAERRAKEQGLSAESLIEEQNRRDHQDSTRKAAPMKVPDQAYVVDTSEMNFEQVVAAVEKHVRAVLKK
jgi:cytidylate kinase